MASSTVHPTEAANEPHVLMRLVPHRYVLEEVFCAVTGYSKSAVDAKIAKGIWLQDRHWIMRGGRRHLDLDAYQRWVETGA